jgi:DNA adenine methylase
MTFEQKKYIEFVNYNNSSRKIHSESPIAYAGGKSRAIILLVALLPNDLTRLVSPFTGGSSFEIAVANKLEIPVIGHDIFPLLVNFWNVATTNAKSLEPYLPATMNKPTFLNIKQELQDHLDNKVIITDKLRLAAYYWVEQHCSFGPNFMGRFSTHFSEKEEPKYSNAKKYLLEFSSPNFSVDLASFEDSITKYKNDFLYLDPPYHLSKKGTVKVGLYPSSDNPIYHVGFNHELLADVIHKHNGKFLMSYNDCPEIRELYKDFNIRVVEWKYSMRKTTIASEIIISNYEFDKFGKQYIESSVEFKSDYFSNKH